MFFRETFRLQRFFVDRKREVSAFFYYWGKYSFSSRKHEISAVLCSLFAVKSLKLFWKEEGSDDFNLANQFTIS